MKISVLMSVYNEPESQIRESVESLLCQTFQDFELIVVCDNPQRTDVKDILDSYKNNRILFYQNPKNVGLAMSMNKAAELARCDIFARMDADDIANPNRFETDFSLLNKGYDIVFSDFSVIDESSKVINAKEAPVYTSTNLGIDVMLDPSIIHHPTTMFTRAIFEKAGKYRDFPCSQDSDLWMRMAEAGARFYYIPEKLLRYRINSQSVSRKRWYQQQLTCNYIFDLSIERMQKGGDSFSVEGYNDYLKKWKVNDRDAEDNLRKCYQMLSDASLLAEKGHRVKSIMIKSFVFLKSPLMRKHYLSLQKKKRLLR